MLDQEIISVIIPNYNNGLYLDECLQSVVRQTHKALEIIVIDDCSTDTSREIISRYADTDNRLVPIFNSENIGVASNRHKGIMMSTGAFVATLDSDDTYCRLDKLEKEYELMFDKKVAGLSDSIAFSGIILLDKNSDVIGSQHNTIREGSIMNDIVRRTCMIPRDFLFTKKQYLAAGGFDSNIPIYEDWDLKIRLSKENQFIYSGIAGIGYRRHGTGLSSASPVYHAFWLMRIFAKNYSLLETEQVKTFRMLSMVICKMIRSYVTKMFRR